MFCMVPAKCPYECFPDFMPFLSGTHKKLKLDFTTRDTFNIAKPLLVTIMYGNGLLNNVSIYVACQPHNMKSLPSSPWSNNT